MRLARAAVATLAVSLLGFLALAAVLMGMLAGGGVDPSVTCTTPVEEAVEDTTGGRGIVAARAILAAGPRWTGQTAVEALAIARAESGYDPNATNPTSSASGLLQIMLSDHASKFAPGESWRDPFANARVAYQIWEARGSWEDWKSTWPNPASQYLADAEVLIAAAQSDASPASATIRLAAAVTGPGPEGVKPHVDQAAAFIRQTWNFTGSIGGYAYRNVAGTDKLSKHALGLAIDVMLDSGDPTQNRTGDEVADYFRGPGAAVFGVENVIWKQRIANRGNGWGWAPMSDRGSYTQNHYDHVHVDFTSTGGNGTAPPEVDPAAADCVTGVGGILPVGTGGGSGTVLTANIPFWLSNRTYERQVHALLAAGPGVLLTQESTDRDFHAYARRAPGNWAAVQEAGEGKAGSAIIYDADEYTLVGSGVELGFRGHVYHRWITWAALRADDGGTFAVASIHLPLRSYDRPGMPYTKAITRAYQTLIRDLDSKGYPTIIGGDWNHPLDARGAPPLAGLGELGYTTNWANPGSPCVGSGPGNGRIDGFGYDPDQFAVTAQGCLAKGPSDHRPVWVQVTGR